MAIDVYVTTCSVCSQPMAQAGRGRPRQYHEGVCAQVVKALAALDALPSQPHPAYKGLRGEVFARVNHLRAS